MSLESAKAAIDDGQPISAADHQASYDALTDDTAFTGTTTGETVVVSGTLASAGLGGALLGGVAPAVNGTAAVGSSTVPAREDHRHPADATRLLDDSFRLRADSGQYAAIKGSSGSSTFTVTVGRMYGQPLVVSTGTLDRIGAEVTAGGGASSVIRLGIYNHNYTTGLPSSLVLDAGTIDGNAVAVQEITISQAVTVGVYWLVAVAQGTGTPSMRTPAVPVGQKVFATATAAAGTTIANAHIGGRSQDSVSGALPSTANATTARTYAGLPCMFVRYA